MESKKENSIISVDLTQNEAIVLLEWLSRFNGQEHSNLFEDQSEERVLYDLESVLEKVINETFREDYNAILYEARKRVRD
jgi:hypothetical protein